MAVLSPPLALSLAASLIASAPAPAEAPASETREDPQLERAMESYELGKKAYNAARYEDALGHFQEAATRYASPDFQYNIGLCYERLGKPEEAVRAFRTYLRAKPDAEDRANVEDRIFELEAELEKAKSEPDPQPQPQPQPQPTSPSEPEPTGTPGRGLIIGGAALAGVGAAVAIGGGLGFGLAARDRSQSVDDVTSGGNPDGLSFAEAETLDAEGRRFETFQIVTAAAGAAVAIGGVAMLAVGLKRKKEAGAGPSATLVPTWSGRSAGLSLRGRF